MRHESGSRMMFHYPLYNCNCIVIVITITLGYLNFNGVNSFKPEFMSSATLSIVLGIKSMVNTT